MSKGEDHFPVETDRGSFVAEALVIATGGPSIPKMGSSDFGYSIAKQFGLNVIEPRPGLVSLTFDSDVLLKLKELAGVSLNVRESLKKVSFSEALLFTHKGLSGPVILQISSYWREGAAITIDLLPGPDVFQTLKEARAQQPKKEVHTVLAQILPKRLAQRMDQWAGCEGRMAETSDKLLRRLAEHINTWQLNS